MDELQCETDHLAESGHFAAFCERGDIDQETLVEWGPPEVLGMGSYVSWRSGSGDLVMDTFRVWILSGLKVGGFGHRVSWGDGTQGKGWAHVPVSEGWG